jgi:Peptidase family S41
MSKTPSFIGKSHRAVRATRKRQMLLREFLSRIRSRLKTSERRRLVEQALVLLDGFYVHLPQKRAMYAVDPVRRLRLLLDRLSQFSDDIALYRELIDIFTSLRDFHTRFELPPPFDAAVAYLPFLIEECYSRPDGPRQYIVSSVMQGFKHPDLVPGVAVTHWNGVPIERAVNLLAAANSGGNPAARHARGLNRLTVRPMLRSLPPDDEWVILSYRTKSGAAREYRTEWLVMKLEDPTAALATSARMTELGLDSETDAIRGAKKVLFAPHVVAAEKSIERKKKRKKKPKTAVRSKHLASELPDVFEARKVPTKSGEFGYLRIRTFVKNPAGLVSEFLRLIELLPQNGLIIDARDNGGGQISAAEQLLQMLTPQTITPEGAQFISTELTRRLCQLNAPSRTVPGVNLSPWLSSLKQAPDTGAAFSGIHPISDPAMCNRIGQRYYGPVVLITNALCYSATDIFTAGFRDHGIGTILGSDGNTGAGGANPFDHSLIRTLFSRAGKRGAGSPLEKLPNGCAFHVAVRRTLRVGAHAGALLEDLGVAPDKRHWMTKNDVMDHNTDLIAEAVRLLEVQPCYALAVDPFVPGATALKVTTRNIATLDVLLDGRALYSGPVKDGNNEVPLGRRVRGQSRLELRGYRGAKLIAARMLEL